MFLFLYLILNSEFYASAVGLALLLIYQIYSLIRFTETTNKELTRFFDSIRYSDFSQTFTKNNLGKSFGGLQESFNRVLDEFKKARSEREESIRYLQTVVQHIGTGLITFDKTGSVSLFNNAAAKLLRVNALRNIKELEPVSKQLVETLFNLGSGEKNLVKLVIDDNLLQLTVQTAEFKIKGQDYKLAAFSNILSELEEKEMEAWQNLIRVLTHEIMNSVTPVSSLAKTLGDMIEKTPVDELDFDDIGMGVQTIHKRSVGLIHFVNNYRNLTKIPKPKFEAVKVKPFLEQIEQLLEQELQKYNIEFTVGVSPDKLELILDPGLIEQVCINLVMNSIHATSGKEKPVINVEASMNELGRPFIKITDNGIGIEPDIQEKIFIPFYTTKQDGSGIGLSLSRQIMRYHGGTIQVHSTPGVRTSFTLYF